jgi:hypothetical protein
MKNIGDNIILNILDSILYIPENIFLNACVIPNIFETLVAGLIEICLTSIVDSNNRIVVLMQNAPHGAEIPN